MAFGLVDNIETSQKITAAGTKLDQSADSFKRSWRESEVRIEGVFRKTASEFEETCRESESNTQKRHELTMEKALKTERELTSALSKAVSAETAFGELVEGLGRELSEKLDESKKFLNDINSGFKSVRRSVMIGLVISVVCQFLIVAGLYYLLTKGPTW